MDDIWLRILGGSKNLQLGELSENVDWCRAYYWQLDLQSQPWGNQYKISSLDYRNERAVARFHHRVLSLQRLHQISQPSSIVIHMKIVEIVAND